MLWTVLIFIAGVAALASLAVWFGMVFVAPRIERASDRAEQGEEPGDRAD